LGTVLKQVRQVAGVKQVKVENFSKGYLSITSAAGKTVSPRALWDVMKKLGYPAKKLIAHKTTYTTRPAS